MESAEVLPWQDPLLMKTFLHRVIEHIAQDPLSWQKQVMILPSRRAITFFHRALAENISGPILPPLCLTWEDMLKREQGIALVDPLRARLELYEVYRTLIKEPEPFELFDSWASAILKDFNTLDTYLIDAKHLYTDLRNLKELDEWSYLDMQEGAEQQSFNHFWMSLGPLYEGFHAALAEKGLATSARALRTLVHAKKETLKGMERIHLLGFNALSHAEVGLLDQWHDEGRLKVYWDSASFYQDDIDNPAGLFIRRWSMKKWDQQMLGSWSKEKKQKIQYSAQPHAIAQCRLAGSILEEWKDEEEQIALVLADEAMLPVMLESLPEELSAINVTMGLPIKGHVLHRFLEQYVLILLDAKRNKELYETRQIHVKSLLRWLDSGVDAGFLAPQLMRGIERKMIDSRAIFLSEKECEALLPEQAIKALKTLDSELDLLDRAVEMLLSLNLEKSLDQGIRETMVDILWALKESVDEFPFIHDLKQLWKCLRSSLAQEKISFIGEPLKGVQMMGLLETRALDFKKVILLGVNEGTLPRSRRFDTFIPTEIRSYYKLPTQKEEDAVFAYYFYRLIQFPEEVLISFSSEKNETGGGEMSRYLRQLILEAPRKHGWNAEISPLITATKATLVKPPEVVVPNSPELKKAIKRFYQKGISVSRLNDFNKCPLDFYFKKLLGLKELVSLDEEVGASELGTLVHEVLEKLYEPHVGMGSLCDVHINQMKKIYPEVLLGQIQEMGLEHLMAMGESALMKEMAHRMLDNFFEAELERVKKGQLEIIGLEQDYVYELPMVLAEEEITFRFTAKVDRAERDAEGLMIIDYKSGKVKREELTISDIDADIIFDPKKSKALQLLFYTWLFWRSEGEIARSGIISMVGKEVDPAQLRLRKGDKLKEEDLIRFEEILLERLVGIYNLEQFKHDQENGMYCDYCPVKAEKSY